MHFINQIGYYACSDWSKFIGYCAGKLVENFHYLQLFYKCYRPNFLWVYRCNKPTWDIGGTCKKLINHSSQARDMQAFFVLENTQEQWTAMEMRPIA